MNDLPEGWVAKTSSKSGNTYYLNTVTNDTQWARPLAPAIDDQHGASSGHTQPNGDIPIVRCRHILVKHRDCQRPCSWREANIVRSKEEALTLVEEYRQRILAGTEDFGELAARVSDCNTASTGGDLGYFGPGKMEKTLEDIAFQLPIGEVSGPVETSAGLHLLWRTD